MQEKARAIAMRIMSGISRHMRQIVNRGSKGWVLYAVVRGYAVLIVARTNSRSLILAPIALSREASHTCSRAASICSSANRSLSS